MSITKDIPITYYNETGHTDFDVIVFAMNYAEYPKKYVVWQVLRGQSSVSFNFPATIQVGASSIYESQIRKCGPFDAEIGSTWEVIQETKDSTAVLRKVTGIACNTDGSVVIKNTKSDCWSGRKFDMGIYRGDKLMLTTDQVHIGDKAVFMIKPLLFFAIAHNFESGEKFSSPEVMSYRLMIDLSKYRNEMDVVLTEQPGGGKRLFTPKKRLRHAFECSDFAIV